MKCVAYCMAQSLQFQDYLAHLQAQGIQPQFFREAAYFKTIIGSGTAFVFTYGTIVFWAVSQVEQERVLKELGLFLIEPMQNLLRDDFSFSFGPSFQVREDQIVLDSENPLVMLSLSHAFAQSVKLEYFEACVQQAVVQAQTLVDQLSQKGKIYLNRREISKRIGWLMQQRYLINLHCDILDTPDFFWDRGELERYYQAGGAYLDLEQRVSVLYRRLDTASEIFEILTTEMNHRHSSFLEWIIIVLILIEVLMSFITHWLPALR
jgi:uncharacterized Rmd1/YagE family protein